MSPPRWRPLPSLAGLDARIRGVSHDARGAYFLLICAADVDGVVHHAADADAVDALAGPGAGACLDELVSFGLAAIEDGDLVLPDVPLWQAEHAPRSAPAPITRPAPEEATVEASPLDRRTAGRRLAKQWTRRGLKDADARVRWLSTEQGRAYLDTAGIHIELATAIATGAATPDATPPATLTPPGGKGGATQAATPPATPGFPPVPPSGEQSTRKDNSTAGAQGATPATPRTPPGGATPATQRHPGPSVGTDAGHGVGTSIGESSRVSSRSSSEEADLLFSLARDSEGRFSVAGSTDQQEAVARVFRESGLETAALLDALKRPSVALAGFNMVTRNNFVSVAMLAGKRPSADAPFPCDVAHTLVAFARAQSAPVEPTSVARTAEETRAYIAPIREQVKRAKESMKTAVADGWKPPALMVSSEVCDG